MRSPPKIGKIFWRFAPKHNDFALIYDPKCPKFSGASRRIFFHREVIFFENCLEFDHREVIFLKSSPNVEMVITSGGARFYLLGTVVSISRLRLSQADTAI